MTLKSALESARRRFAKNGQFSLRSNESVNEVVRREKIPNAPGIYIIFGRDDPRCPLYIGKAGTINMNGTWKRQFLSKRLTMKQRGICRSRFFSELMAKKGVGLTFLWFVTHDQDGQKHDAKVLPALAEMELLQAFYDQYGRLPELNKCA